jgi:hypothetical protein
MMHLCKIISLGFFPIGLLAQNAFEPPDFDITAALLQNGVDVSTIPSLAGLSKRTTSSGGCSIAVRLILRSCSIPKQILC